MKSLLLVVLVGSCQLALAEAAGSPAGQSFQVTRMALGSGTPATATSGTEAAGLVADGLYHVPNYMPGFPTAATIWPRALPLECAQDSATGTLQCAGFEVIPAIGRGEYIFVHPVVKAPPPAPPAIPVCLPEPAPVAPLPIALKKPLG